MKQIHKNIILSAGLLFASAGLMAQTDVEKTDTLAPGGFDGWCLVRQCRGTD